MPPQISDNRGTGGTTEFMGHLQKNKKINEKAKYSAKEVLSVSLAMDTLPLINSFVDHTVFYVGTDSS